MKLSLDQRRSRIDGTCPIIFRITYGGKSRAISTGFTCKSSEWDIKNSEVIISNDVTELLYNRLKEQRLKYQEKLLEFERKVLDSTTDVQVVKDYLIGKLSHKSTVKEFWEEEISRLELINNYGNSRNYNCQKKLLTNLKQNLEF